MKHPEQADTTKAGNAFVYILLAVVLFAGLTLTMTRSQEGDDTSEIDEAKIELYSNNIIQYAASAQRAVDQMLMTASDIGDIDFILPSDGAFETGSDIHKLFHPDGGGLIYKQMPDNIMYIDEIANAQGFSVVNAYNVEWTESGATDIVFGAAQIAESLCAAINKKITGSTAIPTLASPLAGMVEFNTTICAACEGYPALCIADSDGTGWYYYQVLAGR